MSTYNDAHRCATSYVNSPELTKFYVGGYLKGIGFRQYLEQDFKLKDQIVTGFLEQWIPFDISNMSTLNNEDIDNSIDFKNGRSGD